MSSKQDEQEQQQQQQQLYRSLSRKDLQTWCKKLGLPARKSSSVMAESLLSYFQKNGIDLATSGSFSEYQEVLRPMSLVPSHHPAVPLYLTENAFEGCALTYCHKDEGDKGNGVVHYSELETFRGHQVSDQGGLDSITNSFLEASRPLSVSQCAGCGFSHKESLSLSSRFEDIPQSNCVGIDGGATTRRSNGHPIKGLGSFEFYVGSEEGIKLCVDLSSRTCEWIKNYNNQVYLLDNLHKSHSLRQDLGCAGESSKQRVGASLGSLEPRPATDNCTQGASLSSPVEKFPPLVIGHPDGGNQSPGPSSSVLQSSAQDASECLRDDQGHVSFEPNLDMHTLSVSKNVVYSNKLELNINPDPNVTDMPTEKTACNFAVNSTSEGLVDPIAVEYSKQDDEAYENSTLQNSCFTENASFALQNNLASRSIELQLSEAGNYHEDASCSPYENCKFSDIIDAKHSMDNDQDALANSRENGMYGNHLAMCSEERELSNNANWRESSVCSQVDESYAKWCLKSVAAVSNQWCYRQESHVDKDSDHGSSTYEARVLGSTMLSNKVHPRRSMRLVTKQI